MQMGVEGNFFSNRPILLIHDKSASAKLDSPGRASSFHSFELDQSDLRWTMVQRNELGDSHCGNFELR